MSDDVNVTVTTNFTRWGRFWRIYVWLFGFTFPWLDFALGALLGAFMDWFEPPMRDYPVPTWLGCGTTFIVFGAFLRLAAWALRYDWWDDR